MTYNWTQNLIHLSKVQKEKETFHRWGLVTPGSGTAKFIAASLRNVAEAGEIPANTPALFCHTLAQLLSIFSVRTSHDSDSQSVYKPFERRQRSLNKSSAARCLKGQDGWLSFIWKHLHESQRFHWNELISLWKIAVFYSKRWCDQAHTGIQKQNMATQL